MAPEGGLDLGAALLYRRRPGRVHGDDVREELLEAFKVLAPQVVGALQLLERSVFEGPTEDLLRGGAYVRLVLHRTQREEERALGEGLDDDDGLRRPDDAGRLSAGPGASRAAGRGGGS